MKLLSIVIPCYNSQDYMEKCINSLLVGGEDVEILVVNDGSMDLTADIANRYEEKNPTIVKAIHQENGGHGSAVNTGIENAQGLYFKVVDSDDWVDTSAYFQVLDTLREITKKGQSLDMLITNFIYENVAIKKKKGMRYRNVLPVGKPFSWNEAKFVKGRYLLMHALIYHTQLLRDCNLELPKHTFYVDNLYAYIPLPYVKNMYYLDVDFYRYFIGRTDQSVNESIMIKRIDQQIMVNQLMIEAVDLWKLPNKRLRQYMINYLEIITMVSTILCIRSGTEENLQKKRSLWKYIKDKDIRLFHRLRNGIMGTAMNLPGKGGRKFSIAAYRITQKVIGFN